MADNLFFFLECVKWLYAHDMHLQRFPNAADIAW